MRVRMVESVIAWLHFQQTNQAGIPTMQPAAPRQLADIMPGLLPAERWEYRLSDTIRGLTAALSQTTSNAALTIDGVGSCVPTRSARSALVVALRALALAPGSRIAAPLYCCPAVFQAIQAAGFRVRFIDVEPDTFCMSPDDLAAKRRDLDAVVAVHMFGHLCDIPALRKAVPGVPIIEDCAQSIGSTLNGRIAGSLGDVAVFSFRSGKYLSAGEGGALFSSHDEILSGLIQSVSSLPTPGRVEDCVHVAKTYIRSLLRRRPLWGLAGYQLWSIYGNRSRSSPDKAPIVTSKIFRSDRAIVGHRLSMLSRAIEQQRANADYYSRSLAMDSARLPKEKPGEFRNGYLYPILFPSMDHRDAMATYLQKRAITTMQPYKDIAETASSCCGYAGDCPESEEITRRILVVPSHYALKKAEVRRIAQCLNSGWQQLAAPRDIPAAM